METRRNTSSSLAVVLGVLGCACMPIHDLDKASSGAGGVAAGASGGAGAGGVAWQIDAGTDGTTQLDAPIATGGAIAAGGTTATGGVVASGGTGVIDATVPGDGSAATGGTMANGGTTASTTGGSGAGGIHSTGGSSTATGGAAGGTTGATGGSTTTVAPDLPDIFDSPVQGEITYSSGASWDIDGDQWPAFEIHTPTGSYWLVKSDAAIVSINDTSGVQWINYAYGFRPNRGVPNLGGCCQPGNPAELGLPMMTTEIDPAFTITSTHLRLVSKSDDTSYWLVWDFFLTHFTLTINRAGKAFGFTYRGVPGGAFDSADQLVLSSGTALSASKSHKEELPGPAEWAYLTHPSVKQSLFLIQHTDDSLDETYQIADGDTGMFTFGGGQITQTPIRFSLGLIDSSDDKDVRDRIAFVRDAIR